MPLHVSQTPISNAYVGTAQVDKVYLGSNLIWPAGGGAEYTVFGSAPLAYTAAVYDDAGARIELGNIFYLTDSNGPVIGWRCIGARLWVPNDSRVLNKPVTLYAYIGTANTVAIGSDVMVTKSTVTPTTTGWCEVRWETPFTVDYGPDDVYLLITYAFTDPSDQMKYIVASGVGSAALPSVDVGSSLVLSEEDAGYYPRYRRGRYRIGGGGTDSSSSWYGVDIVLQEAPTPAGLTPVAAYNFNEGSGTTVSDATGNGYHLVTQPQYFTANGHTASGIQQTAANTQAIDTEFNALDTAVQPEFTIMFWGKYSSEGTPGANWTLFQTAAMDSGIAWGIMLSDGADTVFQLRIQGFDEVRTVPKQSAGEWHHYALTRNRYYTRAYVDGVMVDESYHTGTVGGDSDHNLRMFDGSMQGQAVDDMRFFAHALDPTAVQYYMNRAA